MKLQSRSREEPEINVISLVDVLLVLVLFFMVSTSFLRETEISLQLPEATVEGQAASPSETLEIMITQSGSYLVNGRELVNNERRTLRAAIERLAGAKRDVARVHPCRRRGHASIGRSRRWMSLASSASSSSTSPPLRRQKQKPSELRIMAARRRASGVARSHAQE